MPDNKETNGNGMTKLTIPTSWAMAMISAMTTAIVALAGYSAKVNADMVRLTEKSVTILQKMDARSDLEFERVHSEHYEMLNEVKAGRREFNKTGKFGE